MDNFKPKALEAWEKEQERVRFAAIAAQRAARAERDANAEVLRQWFGEWLAGQNASCSFVVVGDRLVLTDDGVLLFCRPEGSTPFVMVYGLCPECQRVVLAVRQTCRSLADVGRVLAKFPGDTARVHTCGTASSPLSLISQITCWSEYEDKVFAAFYGMAPEQMKRGFLFTRKGPVMLEDRNTPSRVWDPKVPGAGTDHPSSFCAAGAESPAPATVGEA